MHIDLYNVLKLNIWSPLSYHKRFDFDREQSFAAGIWFILYYFLLKSLSQHIAFVFFFILYNLHERHL